MRELSLHILDIAENSISANASHVIISIEINEKEDRLTISIKDNGKGMSEDMVQRIVDPFITSRTTRKVGLGIPLLKAAAESCNGFLSIHSELGVGTQLIVQFQRSHIDRMPLGDLVGTMLHLIVGSPETHWTFQYKVDENYYEFDDQEIKTELDGIPLSEPLVITYLRNELENGLTNIRLVKEY